MVEGRVLDERSKQGLAIEVLDQAKFWVMGEQQLAVCVAVKNSQFKSALGMVLPGNEDGLLDLLMYKGCRVGGQK